MGSIYLFASKDWFYSFVTEGTAKIVVHGGEFHKIVMSWEGYGFDDKWNVVEKKSGKSLFGGARYIGFYPFFKVYLYRLRWSSPRENGEIVDHDEVLPHVLLKEHIYAVKVKGAEDKAKVPLDIILLITLRVVNPYKFIFASQDTFEVIQNRIAALFRDYVGTKTYAALITAPTGKTADTMWKKLVGRSLINSFESEYGVKVKDHGIDIREITPPAEYAQAATRKQQAEEAREQTIIDADAERRRLEAVYETINKFGDKGVLFRAMEALEKSPLAASMVVQSIPGLQQALQGVLGKQPQDATSQKEINDALKKILAFMAKYEKTTKKKTTTKKAKP